MRFRRFMRPLPHRDAMPPAPPPGLPPGFIVPLGARGETFVRHHAGPPEAPVLLLLHGWTASADLQWCTAYPALTERYSVIAVDHRGHGRGIRSEEPFSLEDCADDAAAVVDGPRPRPAGDRRGVLDGRADHDASLAETPRPRRRHRARGDGTRMAGLPRGSAAVADARVRGSDPALPPAPPMGGSDGCASRCTPTRRSKRGSPGCSPSSAAPIRSRSSRPVGR